MTEKLYVLLFLLLPLTLFANEDSFSLILDNTKNTVTIQLGYEVKNFQLVQLFKQKNEENSVNIFEFSDPHTVFLENAEPDACYFIKVYRNSKSPWISKKKCIPKMFSLKAVKTSMLTLLVLMIFSFCAPGIICFRFFKSKKLDAYKMAQSIKVLAGEDSKSILLHTSSDWIGNPLNIAVYSFFNTVIKKDGGSGITTTLFKDIKIKASSKSDSIKSLPIIRSTKPFLTSIQKKFNPRSAVFHIAENSPESNFDSFHDKNEKRKIVFSSYISGAVTDLIQKRKVAISVEPMLFDSQVTEKGKFSLNQSGVYLFFIVVTCVIIFGSILKTFELESLLNGLLSLIMSSQ